MLESLPALFARHHGALTTRHLHSAGYTKRQIAAEVAVGRAQRFRRGYFIQPGHPPGDAGVATLAGGSLSCVSAFAAHGMWVPHGRRNERHFRLTKTQAKLWPGSLAQERYGDKRDTIHVVPGEWRDSVSDAIDPPARALVTSSECIELEDLVAAMESALRIDVPRSELEALAPTAPERFRTALGLIDPMADSGLETIVRMRLRLAGIATRSQVRCAGWPCDLVIGDWLVIELDGFEYHADKESFARDRRKDRALLIAGYTRLRFTYSDIMLRWPECLAQIRAAMAAGCHTTGRALQEG